jgi:hypothetical protein
MQGRALVARQPHKLKEVSKGSIPTPATKPPEQDRVS